MTDPKVKTGDEGVKGNDPAAGDANNQGNAGDTGQKPGDQTGDKGIKPVDEKTMVPVSVLLKMREEMKDLKGRADKAIELQNQIDLYKANSQIKTMDQPGTTSGVPTGAVNPLDGLGDDDVILVKDLKPLIGNLGKAAELSPETKMQLAKIEVSQQDPNYEQTITKYLPDILKINPGALTLIKQSPNPLMASLVYARSNPQYIADQAEAQKGKGGGDGNTGTNTGQDPKNLSIEEQVDQIIANANKPGSSSLAGGAGAIDTSDRFATMSDEDFLAHMAKVKSGKL
jgi:hypothetical protein